MTFVIPQLPDWRARGRDYVQAKIQRLQQRAVVLPNSPLRVMSDNNAGMAFQVMLYLEWLSEQFLPDKAEKEWLDRQAAIWLPNDGRKQASYASGSATLTGIAGSVQPAGTIYTGPTGNTPIRYQQAADVTLGTVPTAMSLVAIDAGAAGNLDAGTTLTVVTGGQGVSPSAMVVSMTGGADAESDDELRYRVLQRIQKPPMGGDADDYERWALEVPGVTRAWCSPNEMGPGTVTLRFMMDDLRAGAGGFPNSDDAAAVQAYVDARRPVAVRDFFAISPIAEPIGYSVHLSPDTASNRAASEAAVATMLRGVARPAKAVNGITTPAQTIYEAWVNDAIYNTPGVDWIDLSMADHVMPTAGSLATFGNVVYA